MVEMLRDVELKQFTTFKVGGRAKYFARLKNKSETAELVGFAKEKTLPVFVLGGGSNLIVSDENLYALVIKNEILGREMLNESESEVLISVGAGENWDEFVGFCVERGFQGVEALSAIPGTVGGAPIQNIGAYGAEASQAIDSVLVYDVEAKDFKTLLNHDCEFSYRDSIFKKFPGKYIVLEVIFKLQKNVSIKIPNYPGVAERLAEKNISEPTLKNIREVITEIRANKLPNPRIIPNVGSFFKNPIVSREVFEKIQENFPSVKYFETENGIKVPAGWLIETVGLKGASFGPVGTYKNNALVLVNNGGANFQDILNAQKNIVETVKKKFGIKLEREPIVIDFTNQEKLV